jgi:hypothetical protein
MYFSSKSQIISHLRDTRGLVRGEIRNDGVAPAGEQHIFALDVPVAHSGGVALRDTPEHLKNVPKLLDPRNVDLDKWKKKKKIRKRWVNPVSTNAKETWMIAHIKEKTETRTFLEMQSKRLPW